MTSPFSSSQFLPLKMETHLHCGHYSLSQGCQAYRIPFFIIWTPLYCGQYFWSQQCLTYAILSSKYGHLYMWTFLLIQMMPNLYYPYHCNTTPLLCRHMAMPHWCPSLGGWTVLLNLAFSKRADNGKQRKIRELFFNVLPKYAIWMSPTEYDL